MLTNDFLTHFFDGAFLGFLLVVSFFAGVGVFALAEGLA